MHHVRDDRGAATVCRRRCGRGAWRASVRARSQAARPRARRVARGRRTGGGAAGEAPRRAGGDRDRVGALARGARGHQGHGQPPPRGGWCCRRDCIDHDPRRRGVAGAHERPCFAGGPLAYRRRCRVGARGRRPRVGVVARSLVHRERDPAGLHAGASRGRRCRAAVTAPRGGRGGARCGPGRCRARRRHRRRRRRDRRRARSSPMGGSRPKPGSASPPPKPSPPELIEDL